jgi:hypothetical protein
MKDHLSCKFAIFMLLGAALGSGFLSLPYSFQKYTIESMSHSTNFKASFMLLFNYVSGLISCYFLIETCILTNLESFQELIFFYGGGRAGILFITLMQIVVYSLMPIVFMCKTFKF